MFYEISILEIKKIGATSIFAPSFRILNNSQPFDGYWRQKSCCFRSVYGTKILPVTVGPHLRYRGIYVFVHILLNQLLCWCQGMKGKHYACFFAVHIVFPLFQFLVESVTLVLSSFTLGLAIIFCFYLFDILFLITTQI